MLCKKTGIILWLTVKGDSLHPARFERTTYGLGIRPGLFLSTCKIRTNVLRIKPLMTILQTALQTGFLAVFKHKVTENLSENFDISFGVC
jgi:hypothetical protein